MNLADISIRKKTTTLTLTFVVFLGGLVAFENLGRLEDPEFTIKQAVVFTSYPGATASEVEQEVTEVLEEAIQAMGQLREITSISKPGLSIIYPEMQDKYDKHGLPQVWDELRRKVGDAQGKLPPGVQPSIVNDDFGDVFGIFLGLTGEGYSYAELLDQAKFLKRELLQVDQVAKVNFWGLVPEAIYVEMSRSRMAELGISPQNIYNTIGLQNAVSSSGRFRVGTEHIRFDPTGMFDSVEEIGELLIRGAGSDSLVRLKDVATVRRDYQEPPAEIMHVDGRPALGLGVSTVMGGSVVRVGEGVQQRLTELAPKMPVGMELTPVSFQSEDVTKAINGFVVNLIEAVLIVLVVLWIFMGWRSAFIIGGILVLTIVTTFLFLQMWGTQLERISLGALIIALGMLVDNAIVVVDGMLMGIQKGVGKVKAAVQTVGNTSIPLLGATVVAILAFAAVGVSQDATGEYCRALFQVILISLFLSWVFAVTVTPLVGTMLLKGGDQSDETDPYGGTIYVGYRRFLETCVKARVPTLALMVLLFVASLYGFGFVGQTFFPDSTRPQFLVDFWLPEGTHIRETADSIAELDEWVREQEGVTSTATFVGRGALRFQLTYTAEDVNSAYGQLIISVDNYSRVDQLGPQIEAHITEKFPAALAWYKKVAVGPAPPAKIEARFRGPEAEVLRALAAKAEEVMKADPAAVYVRTDWRQPVKVLRPIYAETPARAAGVSRSDLTTALAKSYDGVTIGLFREEDDMIPIVARAPDSERQDVFNINSLQVWASGTQRFVPLRQVVSSIETETRNQIIRRINRVRYIKVQGEAKGTTSEALRRRLDKAISQIELPNGYSFDWSGEYEKSTRAKTALGSKIPVTFLMMVLIVILLFDRFKQPAIIFLTVPMALIGVTIGLLLTRNDFGFMAILGFLSLSGMLIKNAIVLIDETDSLIRGGMDGYQSIIMAGVSRMRPVAMAALTTMLGMIPLFQDPFFVSMAVTIVFGLGFATVLTLLVVPVLYAVFFKIPSPQ